MTELATDRSPVVARVTKRDALTDTPRLGYQPAIDGLRGVAVMAVVLYHAGVGWMSGGFLGVDAFFVVSGFLITTLLIEEQAASGRIDLVQFWVRRIRRLMPALVLLMVGIAAYMRWFAAPETAASIRTDAISSLLYVSNWRFIFDQQSYFDLYSAPSPLRHTWSLAIEEQWYLIWPIVAGAALSWTIVRRSSAAHGAISRRRLDLLALSCVGLAVGSAVLMARLSSGRQDVSRAYFGTDTRAHTLLVGAAVAFLVWGRLHVIGRAVRSGLALAGIVALVAVSFAFVSVVDLDGWLYTGGFLVIAAGWAIVVVAATNTIEGPVQRILAIAPLVAIGKISYGIYLWHWPVQLALTPDRVDWSPNTLIAVRLVLTIALATLSYQLVEQPIRRYRPTTVGHSSRVVFGGALAALIVTATVVVVAAGSAAPTTDIASERPVATSATSRSEAVEGESDRDTLPSDSTARDVDEAAPVVTEGESEATPPTVAEGVADVAPPVAGVGAASVEPPDVTTAETVVRGPVRVVTVGDSVGFDVAYYSDEVEGLDIGTAALLGCGIVPDELWVGNRRIRRPAECADWLEMWTQASAADIVVVFLGTWEVFDPHIDGRRVAVGSEEWNNLLSMQLQAGIDALTANGAQVVLMTVPCFDTNGMMGEIPSTERDDSDRIAAVNERLRAAHEANPGNVSLVDWAAYICPDGKSRTLDDGTTMRTDGVHPDIDVMPVVWNWLAEQLPELTGTDRTE